MKSFKYSSMPAILALLISANVYADSQLNPWVGAYAQIGVGYENYIPKNANGTTTTATGYSFPNVASANHANGPAGNIGIGYNFGAGDSFVIGLGAAFYPGHSKSASSTLVTTIGNTPVVKTGTYDVSNVFSFSLIPGYVINKTHLIYAKVGYAGSTINANSAGNYPQQTNRVNGTVYGLGYKQFLPESSIYFFGEGNYAVNRPKSVTVLTDSGSTVASTANATGYDILIGLGYHF